MLSGPDGGRKEVSSFGDLEKFVQLVVRALAHGAECGNRCREFGLPINKDSSICL